MPREQKITFGEMRESGVRSVIVACADYRCGHSTTALADGWPDDIRLSDIEDRLVCKAWGDVAPRSGRSSGRRQWVAIGRAKGFEFPRTALGL